MKSANDEINLLLISDVHHAQASSDEDLLIHDLSVKLPNRLILGVGDELDCISRADKRHDPASLKDKFFTKENYSRLVDAEVEDYCDLIKAHTKPEEWLGHISGNHPLVMSEYGMDPIERMCVLLGHTYLGYSAFVPVNINPRGTVILPLMIMAHHGFGGGGARKEGAGLNAYIDHAMRFEGWDLAVYGHRHDRWSKTVPRIKPQESGGSVRPAWVRAVDRKVCQCGTYLRTLSHSKMPSYSEKAGYPPRPTGCLHLRIGFRRIRDGGRDNIQLEFKGSNE